MTPSEHSWIINKISTQIIEFKILDNSVVIFQALKTFPALLTLVASATSTAQFSQTTS